MRSGQCILGIGSFLRLAPHVDSGSTNLMVKPADSGPKFDMPATYRISFRGYLPQSWSDRLNGMTIATCDEASEEPVTVLSGWLPDQAALIGVLNTLYNLHFPLLSVELAADG
jgi:hypothetical protein